MHDPKTVTFDAIRAAGGIVHSDGNIFFTNAKQFRTAAVSVITQTAQSTNQEVFAWATNHDEPMLFLDRDEAAQYCEDDEQPVPLYAAPVNGGEREMCPLECEGACKAEEHGCDEDCASLHRRATDAPQVGDEVRYFRQPSSFGPWHECFRTDEGAVAFVRRTLSSPAKVGGDEREAYRADMIAAGAKDLGNGTWEWDGGDFLFQLWRQARAALSADDGDRKDAERLDWMTQRSAYVAQSRDGESCWVMIEDPDEDSGRQFISATGRCYDSTRDAIDAAIVASTTKGE